MNDLENSFDFCPLCGGEIHRISRVEWPEYMDKEFDSIQDEEEKQEFIKLHTTYINQCLSCENEFLD